MPMPMTVGGMGVTVGMPVAVPRVPAAAACRMLQVIQQQHPQEAAHQHQACHALGQALMLCRVAVAVTLP